MTDPVGFRSFFCPLVASEEEEEEEEDREGKVGVELSGMDG